MNFKMAPNSLFAILLRSPWWISIGIAVVFGAASRALLPDTYWAFGAMGGIPFLGIGGITAWRQVQAPSGKRVDLILKQVANLSWPEFSQALATAFAADGYRVERIEGVGADLLLAKQGLTTLVAARRWKAARHGVDAVQELAGAMRVRDASHGIYVALGGLSDKAERLTGGTSGIRVLRDAGLAHVLRRMELPR
jgi:restriction system protein